MALVGEALHECQLEPVVAVHAAECLPQVANAGSGGVEYLMGAHGRPVYVLQGLVQGYGVRLADQDPALRLMEGCDVPAREVSCRTWKYRFKLIGGCPRQEGAHQEERVVV